MKNEEQKWREAFEKMGVKGIVLLENGEDDLV